MSKSQVTLNIFVIGNSELTHTLFLYDTIFYGDRQLQFANAAITDEPDYDGLKKITEEFARALVECPVGFNAFFLIINLKNLKVNAELQRLKIYKEILGNEFFTKFGCVLISEEENKKQGSDFSELRNECSNRVMIFTKGKNNSLQLNEAQQNHKERLSILGNNLEMYTKVLYDKNETKRTRLLNNYKKSIIELEYTLQQSDITDKVVKVMNSNNNECDKVKSLEKILLEVKELLNKIENNEFKDLHNVKESVLKTKSTVESYIKQLKSKTSEKRQLDLVLLGKTGSGKSSTGNSILLRDDAFESLGSFSSVTSKPQYEFGEFEDCILQVVDAPGVGDTGLTEREGLELITKSIQQAVFANPIGYHAFLIIIKYGTRYTREEEKAIGTLKNILGDDFIKRYGIIIICGGDSFKKEIIIKRNTSFETFCSLQIGPLKELIDECKNRVLLFDNNTDDITLKQEQVKNLVQMVDKLNTGGKRYTNKQFLAANETRKKMILESSKNLIEKETLQEQSLILQSMKKARSFPDNISKVESFIKVLQRIDSLLEKVKQKDKKTGVLQKMVENIQETKKAVENEIEWCNKIINEKIELEKKEKAIKLESEQRMLAQREELQKKSKMVEERIKNEMLQQKTQMKEQLENEKRRHELEEKRQIEENERVKREKEAELKSKEIEKQRLELEMKKKLKEEQEISSKKLLQMEEQNTQKAAEEAKKLQQQLAENERIKRKNEAELKSKENEKNILELEMQKRITEVQENMTRKLQQMEEENNQKAVEEIKQLQERIKNERRQMEKEMEEKRQRLQEQYKEIKEENDENIFQKFWKWLKSLFT